MMYDSSYNPSFSCRFARQCTLHKGQKSCQRLSVRHAIVGIGDPGGGIDQPDEGAAPGKRRGTAQSWDDPVPSDRAATVNRTPWRARPPIVTHSPPDPARSALAERTLALHPETEPRAGQTAGQVGHRPRAPRRAQLGGEDQRRGATNPPTRRDEVSDADAAAERTAGPSCADHGTPAR